jgi:hypothetical protein
MSWADKYFPRPALAWLALTNLVFVAPMAFENYFISGTSDLIKYRASHGLAFRGAPLRDHGLHNVVTDIQRDDVVIRGLLIC